MISKKDLTTIEGIMMLHAVKECSSKRNAAQQLNVSLDTLDKYIHLLEDETGAKMVTATGRGCAITKSGEKILQNIDFIEKCVHNIDKFRQSETEIRGEVHVVYDLSIRSGLHSRVIKYLFKSYPEITLCVDNVVGVPDMRHMEYDISLSYGMPEGQELVIITSRKIPCKFFASAEYLQNHSYPQSLQDIIAHHSLILSRENWEAINAEGIYQDYDYKGIFFSNSDQVAGEVAVNGGGIAVMPYYIGKLENHLVCLDKLECPATNILYLVSHKERKDIPKVRIVLDYYKEMINQL